MKATELEQAAIFLDGLAGSLMGEIQALLEFDEGTLSQVARCKEKLNTALLYVEGAAEELEGIVTEAQAVEKEEDL